MDNQQFEELLIKDLTGDLTQDERLELQTLLQTDISRRKEYDIFKDFWAQKDIVYANTLPVFEKVKDQIRVREEAGGLRSDFSLPAIAVVPTGRLGQSGRLMTPRRRRLFWRSVAAVLIFSLGGYGVYHYYRAGGAGANGRLDWQEKYTARRTKSRMILADGSSVMLNADSRLKYPASFDGPVREVYLTGEAFFTIQKDPEHPFIIHTDKMNIRVLGTSFNVKSYPDDAAMETTLLQGSIEVTFPDRPADKIILKPTDKLVIANMDRRPDQAGNAVMAAAAAAGKKTGNKESPATKYSLTALTYYRNHDSTIVETSWVDNKLAFSNEEFQSLAQRMERWYGVNIVFDNPELKKIPFTGLFQKESIEEAMYALKLSEKFQYSIKGSVIHIY
jgi:ferric-dicitrate binding protein FerR (iron transport regulator)